MSRMTQLAAGQPFYENTWPAAATIVVIVIILGTILMLLIMVTIRMIRWIWRIMPTASIMIWIRRSPKSLRWVMAGSVCLIAAFVAIVFSGVFQNKSVIREAIFGSDTAPSPQVLFQQNLTMDEQALDKGVLTYTPLPVLKEDLTTPLTATVTDLGKNPNSLITAQAYSQYTGMVVYPRDVPTGGIVGLRLICTADVYCQELSSTRQAVVGFMTSQTWSWNITALQPGPT